MKIWRDRYLNTAAPEALISPHHFESRRDRWASRRYRAPCYADPIRRRF